MLYLLKKNKKQYKIKICILILMEKIAHKNYIIHAKYHKKF